MTARTPSLMRLALAVLVPAALVVLAGLLLRSAIPVASSLNRVGA